MTDLDQEVIALFQGMGDTQGMDSLGSAIYAIAFLAPEDLSLDDISQKTGYSLASISSKVAMMEQMRLVKKIHRPGTKKIFVSLEKDIMACWKNHLQKVLEMKIIPLKEKLPDIIRRNPQKANEAKVKLLEQYHRQMAKVEKLLQEFIRGLND